MRSAAILSSMLITLYDTDLHLQHHRQNASLCVVKRLIQSI